METETLQKHKVDRHNRIIWIILVTLFWYVVVFSSLGEILLGNRFVGNLLERIGYEVNAMKFGLLYATTLVSFVGIFVYCAVTKRNHFVLETFLPRWKGNTFGKLLWGLAVGFLMNFACIACALVNGDIKLYLGFTVSQLPFYILVFLAVFIQSSSEELWCRGFMQERINVHYPLWVAVLVNGLFFAVLHLLNPGISVLPVLDIAFCGLSFALAKWYTDSIWFPMGIHTAWNFTQNLVFGLPNSGLVSEASILHLDAAGARDSFFYNVAFGVEGSPLSVILNALLGIIILILAAKNGRLGELKESYESKGKAV